MNSKYNLSDIVNHLKMVGFVFPSFEIYGGLANAWDYGPLGSVCKNLLKNQWWDHFITKNIYNVGLDTTILTNKAVLEASGHTNKFFDYLIECKKCHKRYRADKFLEKYYPFQNIEELDKEELTEALKKADNLRCPNCNNKQFTDVEEFRLIFETFQGSTTNSQVKVYLRPETAQGIFVNFKNIQRSMRLKLPFGIGQIGKSFRNEITPGNFIFRVREFEQMELEFFFNPKTTNNWFEVWKGEIESFLKSYNIVKKLRVREHADKELAHYASRTIDFEYNFPFGWSELWGLSNRTNYDLSQHEKFSGQDLTYFDQESGTKILPHVVEPSVGVERLLLAIFCESYCVEELPDKQTRTVMKFAYKIAPYQVAIFPLSKQLHDKAFKIFNEKIINNFRAVYDTTGNIGKRYRRQDAIGTPFCVTIDFKTIEDNSVTIRNRDTMAQERIKLTDIVSYLNEKLSR